MHRMSRLLRTASFKPRSDLIMDTVRPQTWKFVVFLIAAFVSMIAPVAVGIALEFAGPPPYVLHEDQVGPEWTQPAPRAFPDGSTVTVHTYADEAAARDGTGAALQGVPRESTEYTLSMTRYTRRDGGRRGLVLAVGNQVIHIEAADDRTVDARLADLPFLAENPEKGPIALLFARHLSLTLLGIAGFFLLWFALTMRAGSWAASISPAPGVEPVPAETLRARLLAVNDLGLPFRVREEGRRLVAEWRIADARWVGLMEVGGLTRAHQVYLELDPRTHKVLAQDRDRTISWGAGAAGLGGSWSFFRGINFFQYERGALVGLFFKDGDWATTAYDYRFCLAEMKNPLIQAIVGSGWTFAPVVTLFRPLAALRARGDSTVQASPASGTAS
jgi:hypothetical protein